MSYCAPFCAKKRGEIEMEIIADSVQSISVIPPLFLEMVRPLVTAQKPHPQTTHSTSGMSVACEFGGMVNAETFVDLSNLFGRLVLFYQIEENISLTWTSREFRVRLPCHTARARAYSSYVAADAVPRAAVLPRRCCVHSVN
jgi:hypothetical protein